MKKLFKNIAKSAKSAAINCQTSLAAALQNVAK